MHKKNYWKLLNIYENLYRDLFVKILFIVQLLFGTRADNQFKTVESFDNGVDGLRKSFHACQFDNQVVDNESEIINTDSNQKSNSDVQMVLYHERNTMSVIPNNIFQQFPNLEYLWIGNDQKCSNFKPEYLRGANHLKTLRMSKNLMTKVMANAYTEAPNLENINLQFNNIEFVHVFGFNGLSNLKGIYLKGNPIKELHSLTFSWLNNIMTVDLVNCNCMNKEYNPDYLNFAELQTDISLNCPYPHTADLRGFKAKDPVADFMLNSLDQSLIDLKKKSSDLEILLQNSERKCTDKVDVLSNSFQDQMKLILQNVQTLLSQKVLSINQNFQNHENTCQLKFQNLKEIIEGNHIVQSQINEELNKKTKSCDDSTKTLNNNFSREIRVVKTLVETQNSAINIIKEDSMHNLKNLTNLLHSCETANNLKLQNLGAHSQQKLSELANSFKHDEAKQSQHLNESLTAMSQQIHQFGAICDASKNHATSNFGELKKMQNKLTEVDESIESLKKKTQENEEKLNRNHHGHHGQLKDSDVKSMIF